MIQALKWHMDNNMSAYAAAIRAGVDPATMYRNRYYQRYRDCGGDPGVIAEIRRELDVTRPEPRQRGKKRNKYAQGNT